MERIGGLRSVGRGWSNESAASYTYQTLEQELRLAAIHDPPYLFIHPQSDGSHTYDGYLYQLWKIVARELGLRYRIVALLEGGYGSLDANGTWIGMVGELAYGRADVALTGLLDRPDRRAVVDYIDTVAVVQDQATLFIRKSFEGIPELGPAMFNSLLRPLDVDVWWLLLACLLVTSVLLRVSTRFNHTKAESPHTLKDMSWSTCLLFSFMSMVGQSWSRTPSSLAARTVTFCSWILGILICTNYTAILISQLTISTVDRPIKTLRDFSEQSDWLLAIEPGYGVLNDWKSSRDVYERGLYRRTITGEGYIRLNVTGPSLRRVTQKKVMTFIDFGRLLYFVGHEACQFVPLLDNLPEKANNYMVIAKGNYKLRRAINRIMQRLNQAGIIRRLKKYWMKTEDDTCNTSESFKELSFADLLSVLVLVPMALFLSMVIFTAEWVLCKSKWSFFERYPTCSSLFGRGRDARRKRKYRMKKKLPT